MKVGDKVRYLKHEIVTDAKFYERGRAYTISSIDGFKIQFKEVPDGHFLISSQLELLKEGKSSKPEIKLGDKVIFTDALENKDHVFTVGTMFLKSKDTLVKPLEKDSYLFGSYFIEDLELHQEVTVSYDKLDEIKKEVLEVWTDPQIAGIAEQISEELIEKIKEL